MPRRRQYVGRVRVDARRAFYWHAFFLAVTTSLTEVNTVMPALVIEAGGTVVAVGALTAIMIGLPLVSQLLFAGFLHTRQRKKPYLLLGINLRVVALAFGAASILTLGVSPLKVFQFCSQGKPVVATPVPEIAKLSGLIEIAEGPENFIAAIERAMSEKDETVRRKRIDYARENTWSSRAEQVIGLFDRLPGETS